MGCSSTSSCAISTSSMKLALHHLLGLALYATLRAPKHTRSCWSRDGTCPWTSGAAQGSRLLPLCQLSRDRVDISSLRERRIHLAGPCRVNCSSAERKLKRHANGASGSLSRALEPIPTPLPNINLPKSYPVVHNRRWHALWASFCHQLRIDSLPLLVKCKVPSLIENAFLRTSTLHLDTGIWSFTKAERRQVLLPYQSCLSDPTMRFTRTEQGP
jgi:hypothetical protein